MARGKSAEPGEAPIHRAGGLAGYRMKRGFIVFQGRRHWTLPTGTVVAADDPVVPILFQAGAELEPVME